MTGITSSTELRRKVLQDTDQIPPLPEVIVRVIALLNEPDTEPKELEEVLRCDHVLVARLLAMVNSPFYGMRRNVQTIKDAIMVLGYQNVRSMVMITSTSKFMRQDFDCYGHDDKGLWKHAVAVAAACRELATQLGEAPVVREELFVAALLHDIGKMVLGKHLAQFGRERIQSYSSHDEAERALLEITHAEAGDLVASKWNLSPMVHSVIADHHGHAIDMTEARYVSIVRLADALAHEVGIGYQEGHAPVPKYLPEDLACLGLDTEQWTTTKDRLREAMELAVTSMGGIYA